MWKLLLISFASLFFEILVIRWVACEIRIFSYFKNFILMGAFVGLGTGCASATLPRSVPAKKSALAIEIELPFLLLILVCLLSFAQKLGLTDLNFIVTDEVYNWLPQTAIVRSIPHFILNVSCMIGVFALVVSIFDELGRLLGVQLSKHNALNGYQINLAGSLLGVVIYGVLAFMGTSPGVWLAIGAASLLLFYRKWWHWLTFAVCVIVAFVSTSGSIWSPYYRIDTFPYLAKLASCNDPKANPPGVCRLGTHVEVNRTWFQATINLSDKFVGEHPELRNSTFYGTYSLPYEVAKHPENVLILGAGTGNDVASALRHGAKHVDAVEIDPSIQKLGRDIHPEQPYSDPRVTAVADDARAFLTRTKTKYDLIVFGFVDSHTAFSTMSSVRLDNYLYTTESIAEATKHLSSTGIGALSFAAGAEWLRPRLFQIVAKGSNTQPLAMRSILGNPGSIVILWGPGLAANQQQMEDNHKGQIFPTATLSKPAILCTDDWPFLYQRDKALTFVYQLMLGMIVLTSGLLVASRFKFEAKSLSSYMHFFLLGAGFLLMETRSMLAASLLFGSTWLVNSIVISMVLIGAIIANWAVSRFSFLNRAVGYAGIFLSIAVLYLVPLESLLQLDILPRLAVGVALIGAPFLFAGITFSRTFSEAEHPEMALGMNIMGGLIGGCLEYFSMLIGSNNLLLLAAAIYATALISDRLVHRSKAPTEISL